MKVRLPNGNVTGRILPVKIHDLDPDDKTLLENELGGVLRSIELIYKSAGVNMPLRAIEDHPQNNLNRTYYRDQINKVANSIKEIISGLKTEPAESGKEKIQHIDPSEEVNKEQAKETHAKPFRSAISKLFPVIIIMSMLVVAAIIAYPKIFKRDTLEKLRSSGERISVAVMPFQNLTNDTLKWDAAQDIIQNSLTTSLSNFPQDLQSNKKSQFFAAFFAMEGREACPRFSPPSNQNNSQKI